MKHYVQITSIDDQIQLVPQTVNDEIEEGSKVDHLIDIPDTNGQDPSGSQKNKSINENFDEKFKDLNNSSIKSCTIFKVNVWLRESNPDAYTPKMVSIGPYHKKNPQLHPMKKYKLLCLQQFLGRKEGLDVESCISELEKLKEKAITCYEDVKYDSQFCQMLLLDGCFVVQFFRHRCEMCPEGEDKIFSNNNIGYILRDLMLLENQLPFFILNKLYDMTKRDYESPLAALLREVDFLPFFDKFQERYFIDIRRCYDVKHILHLVHITYTSCHGNRKKKLENNDVRKSMPNATKLSEAGVSFKKVNITTTPFASIEFKKGLMKIPRFEVVDSAEIYLRNLIAYEQQTDEVHPKYFSDFATFMDQLIDSDKDVNLLHQKGIIVNRIGEDKGVTNLFNKIGNGVMRHSDFYYQEEFTKASQHCENWWNRKKANLKHNYFSSPWVGASTVAAIILLILTIIQTVLAFTGSIM